MPMAENDNSGGDFTAEELAEDIKLDDDVLAEDFDPSNASPEMVTKLIKTSQTALAQKKHWRGKAIEPDSGKPYSELLKTAKEDKPNASNDSAGAQQGDDKTPTELEKDVAGLKISEEKRSFGHANNFSPEETDHVFAFAAGAGKKPSEVLEHPFIKSGIAAMRQQQGTDDATPGPSGRSPIVEGKTFKEMDDKDRRKNFDKVVQGTQK